LTIRINMAIQVLKPFLKEGKIMLKQNVFQKTIILMVLVFGILVKVESGFGNTIWVDCLYEGVIKDGTPTHPYNKINKGILESVSDDIIKVLPGVYEENVIIDENLTLSGMGPDSTIIKGSGGTAITIKANYNVTVEGFTITKSQNDGIYIESYSSAIPIIIRNVVSVANTGSGLWQDEYCNGIVACLNCTFTANGEHGARIWRYSTFTNCISTSNGQYGFRGYSQNGKATYCNAWNNISGGFFNIINTFCISMDSKYIDSDTGDYRLRSDSSCRNAGSPDSADQNPDGTRNDMGAYGGPGAAGFYYGYGNGPIVTDLLITPASVPLGGTFNINATAKAQ